MYYNLIEEMPPIPPIEMVAVDPKRANYNMHIIGAKTYTRTIRGRRYEFTYHARKGWRRRYIGRGV